MTSRQEEEPLLAQVAGKLVRVTHPSKVLFPDDGITKAEILQYYLSVAPHLLPHLKGRPVILKAWPHGIKGRPYYRHRIPDGAPPWLSRVDTDEGPAPVVQDEADLLWVANQDSVELHPWLSRRERLTHPDLLLFDLDPGPLVAFRQVCEAALALREALEGLGLQCWAKTSGGGGIHVMVGLEPRHEFKDVHAWAFGVARALAEHRKGLLTVDYAKAHRTDKVLIDHGQIRYGQSTVSIYSVRPLPGATVSAPVTWEEVASGTLRPRQFTLRTMPERLAASGDVAAGLAASRQALPGM